MTVGPNGTYLNAGIPGTGLSFRERIGPPASPTHEPTPPEPEPIQPPEEPFAPRDEIKSAPLEEITSAEFAQMREMIQDAHKNREKLRGELVAAESDLSTAGTLLFFSKVLIVGFFIKWFAENRARKREARNAVQERFESSPLSLDIAFDANTQALHDKMNDAFKSLSAAERIWNTTSMHAVDSVRERTVARSSIERSTTTFATGGLDVLRAAREALQLSDSRGLKMLVYPAFIVIGQSQSEIGVLGYNEVELRYIDCCFNEEESRPADARQVGTTWKKANKDGSPDRRFKGNYQIPILLYGELVFRSATGLHERFLISNRDAAKKFADTFHEYQRAIPKSSPS